MQPLPRVADVVVIERVARLWWRPLLPFAFAALTGGAQAAVLPDDRADLMYHLYDGGGVTVQGPALLVRKRVDDSVSLSGHYYMDMVSGASIDVMTTASPYRDTRNEYGLGVDYLFGKSLMSATFTSSEESDYRSDTYSLGVSHDLFGGLTTLSMGYGQGHDTILKRGDAAFLRSADRYNFRLGVTQILTRTSLIGVAYEGITDNGYLSNPYRVARWGGGATAPENYPTTRDSQAIAIRYLYGFSRNNQPVHRSYKFEYRYAQDTWGIHSHTTSVAMQQQFGQKWLGEFHIRYYRQNAASFYNNDFPVLMTYMARDKELSTFSDYSLGVKFSWAFADRRLWFFSRASLNFAYDYIKFIYDDFTDVRNGQLYSFGANVGQVFISGWY